MKNEQCKVKDICQGTCEGCRENDFDILKIKGALLCLPCNVGDTVYFTKAIFSALPAPMAEEVRKIEITKDNVLFRTKNNRAFDVFAIGETVFLTREEAEQALKERQGEKR